MIRGDARFVRSDTQPGGLRQGSYPHNGEHLG